MVFTSQSSTEDDIINMLSQYFTDTIKAVQAAQTQLNIINQARDREAGGEIQSLNNSGHVSDTSNNDSTARSTANNTTAQNSTNNNQSANLSNMTRAEAAEHNRLFNPNYNSDSDRSS